MYPLYTQERERESPTHRPMTEHPSENRWVGALALLMVVLMVLVIFSAVFGITAPDEPAEETVDVTTQFDPDAS
jgi:hypothetical protein